MKIAIISDIHGNMEAFLSVLNDMRLNGVAQALCLGDCIGYGPDPHKVLEIIKAKNIPTVLGNHELALLKPGYLSWFNPVAQKSLVKTRAMLTPAALDQIAEFPRFLIYEYCRIVHGFPPDLPKMYLFQAGPEKLLKTFEAMEEKICFLGHTHQLEIITFDGHQIHRSPLTKGIFELNQAHRYIINVGSVGQPRDGNNCSKYIIWDRAKNTVEVRFITYDIATTVAKIRQAGLPEAHAKRLW